MVVEIIGTIIFGAVIGMLARLVLPGRQNISALVTVILGVLCMLFSDLNSNRALGPVAALGIAASLLMSSAFLDKIKSDGVLTYDPGRNTEYVMDMLRDSYSPFCCWLGEEKVKEILAASSNASLEETGILKQFEREVAARNKKVQRQLRRLK